MKGIGDLLSRGRPGERAEFSAAFVVGAMNDVLQNSLQLTNSDAKAISYKNGTITIGVSHGAVAGLIQQSAQEILEAANKKMQASGLPANGITKILTRPMSLQ